MFLGAGARHAAATIIGAPYDRTSTFRRGSAHGPAAIRWASQSIETYSPVLRADLAEAALGDAGDLDLAGLEPEDAVAAVAAGVGAIAGDSIPLLLGGEHTITVGAVRAVRGIHRDLAVLQLDAHTDLRDAYEGQMFSHATVMKRIVEMVGAEAVVAAGIRAGTREEFALARAFAYCGPQLALPPAAWALLASRPVYVTIDIDAVDPAEAPGTGNPEPEGLAARDVLSFVRRLGALRVVGLDIVEVAPSFDPSGRTAVLAATLIREAVLALSGPRPA
ncbi:MAG TPA: agmatinase [bacterium]|nr:agmatinase [bacterium]